jgi:hypothetical protein
MTHVPTRIVFKGLAPSENVERRVHLWIAKLLRVSDQINRCDVVIEMPHRHHRQGRRFHLRIELAVPGRVIVVAHDGGSDAAHEDALVAARDAFLAARRQLEVYVAMTGSVETGLALH